MSPKVASRKTTPARQKSPNQKSPNQKSPKHKSPNQKSPEKDYKRLYEECSRKQLVSNPSTTIVDDKCSITSLLDPQNDACDELIKNLTNDKFEEFLKEVPPSKVEMVRTIHEFKIDRKLYTKYMQQYRDYVQYINVTNVYRKNNNKGDPFVPKEFFIWIRGEMNKPKAGLGFGSSNLFKQKQALFKDEPLAPLAKPALAPPVGKLKLTTFNLFGPPKTGEILSSADDILAKLKSIRFKIKNGSYTLMAAQDELKRVLNTINYAKYEQYILNYDTTTLPESLP